MSIDEMSNIFSLFKIGEILNRASLIEIGAANLPFENDGFNLLKSVNDNNSLNLENILNYEKSHIQLFPRKNYYNPDNYYSPEDESNNKFKNKNNFFKDSFFNQILSNKESKEAFKKINLDKNFETKFNSGIHNSTQSNFLNILKLIEKKGMKEIQEKLDNQIKSLTPFQKESVSLISNMYKVPKEIKEIKYYKKVKPNGDSFYISFIYQYIRNLISNGDDSIIIRIINLEREYNILNPLPESSIKDLGKIYLEKTKSLLLPDLKNLGPAFTYLGIIYNLITVENDINNALKMFDLSFSYDQYFWKLLCLFMKSHIKDFLGKNKELFTMEEYCINNNLIPQKYFSVKDNTFDYELYINDNIFINQMEPSLFIISIVPYIFNVSLNLFINEEGTQNQEDNNQLFKLELNPDKNMDINILYSSYSYHIIECKDEENLDINIKINFDICSVFNNTKGIEFKNNQNKKDYINTFVNREKCNQCKNDIYIKIKSLNNNYPQCLNCFKNLIDEVLIKRYKYMINEQFRYIEYYLKEIPLLYIENFNDYINLSQTEFFQLFDESLFTYFRKLIFNICDLCGNYFKIGKIIHKICGCKICIECAKLKHDLILLNDFEKNHVYKVEKIKCECGKELELINYSSQISNLLNNDEKQYYEKRAKERINNYIKNNCMICGKNLEKNKISINKKIGFSYNFVVCDLNKNKKIKEHNLCEDCNEKKMKNKNSNENIFCIICNEYHEFNNGINNISIQNNNPVQDPNIDKPIDEIKNYSEEKYLTNKLNDPGQNNKQIKNSNEKEEKNSEGKEEPNQKKENKEKEEKENELEDQKEKDDRNNDQKNKNNGNNNITNPEKEKEGKNNKKKRNKNNETVCCIIY